MRKIPIILMVASIILIACVQSAIAEVPVNTTINMPKKISICTDTNFQFPFSFMKNKQPVGLHIDIIAAALSRLGVTPDYQPTTWQSCLDRARAGRVDSVATAAYLDERATYMNYPSDATIDNKSSWRLTQVEYKVISPILNESGDPNTYEFNGDLSTIPQPVRVPAGYFIVLDLQKARLKIKENKYSLQNFRELLQEHTGSVVDLSEVAEHLRLAPEFQGKFIIQKTPLVVKSYYLAFAKQGTVSLDQAQVIWNEIAKIRENRMIMSKLLKKYE